MNVNTLVISAEEARLKLDQYRRIQGKQRTREDDKLESLYASISKGARVINVAAAFKQTGLNDKGQPKLAIARGDWSRVWFHPHKSRGRGAFTPLRRVNDRATATNFWLPGDTFDSAKLIDTWTAISSPVPHIPPDCRPRFGLHNYHILFVSFR